jgi:hypothetical protein
MKADDQTNKKGTARAAQWARAGLSNKKERHIRAQFCPIKCYKKGFRLFNWTVVIRTMFHHAR